MPHAADPYIDPETGILRNLVNARSAEELAGFEADLTAGRTIQLQASDLVPPTRDLTELRSLHRHIFQDLFDWAGEIRTIDMRRGQGKFFAPCVGIESNAFHVFTALSEKDHLQGLPRDDFIRELADFYDQLNFIHPFREGNGRTQRLFWSRLSHDAGWVLDWRPIHGEQLDEVSRAAREDGKLADLQAAFTLCVFPR